MRRGLALMVCVVFTIVAVAGLCWADHGWVYEGMTHLVGKVVKGTNDRFFLKTGKGGFLLQGADASAWVGKKVKVWGELKHRGGALRKVIEVYEFKAAE